jgi:hypothetical protein
MRFDLARLTPAVREELLVAQDECTVAWTNDDGWPVGVVHTYVWRDGAFWVTAFRSKPRVAALQTRPHAAVVVSSKGTDVGPEKMASARVVATVHDDEHTKAWFYSAFVARTRGDAAVREQMARALARQDRVIIELRPVSWTSFDGMLLRRAARQ